MSAKLTQDAFLEKAHKKHGDKYDYSKVQYKNCRTPISICCKVHGAFSQIPIKHLIGHGCPFCASTKKMDTQSFIQKARKKHGAKYDYSKVKYLSAHSKITIICPEHGEFFQKPGEHLSGNGCKYCWYSRHRQELTINRDEFIKRARQTHGDTYDYTKVDYLDHNTKVEIICKKHGSFFQTPSMHIFRSNCPRCFGRSSKPEQELCDLIKGLLPEVEIIRNSRKLITPQELDIYLPEYKLAIEYCGLYWHSSERVGCHYHLDKFKACTAQGIKLITLFENEWIFKRPIVESKLKNLLGLSSKMAARKLAYVELARGEAKAFFDTCHLQGHRNAGHYIGLVDAHRTIYMAMALGKSRYSKKSEWELIRLATRLDWNVIGGASKLFTHFINQHQPHSIVSYSDLRWGTGERLYPNLGFQLSHRASPNYFYFNNNVGPLYSRVQFQKHKLSGKLEFFDPLKSELENMSLNGWARIHDCGNNVFTWTT